MKCFKMFSAILLVSILLLGCDNEIIVFKNKVKGRIPYELSGNYLVFYEDSGRIYSVDTIRFKRTKKNNFEVIQNAETTIYTGEIVRKLGKYYLNSFDSATKCWHISSFAISDDSIYNFPYAFWRWNDYDEIKDYFDNIESVKDSSLTTYYIDNTQKETRKAFKNILKNAKGHSIKEIFEPEDSVINILQTNNIEEQSMIAKAKLKVYPNPCSDILNIENSVSETFSYKLFSIDGKELKSDNSGSQHFTLNVSDLCKGVYILIISKEGEKEMESVKIVKR